MKQNETSGLGESSTSPWHQGLLRKWDVAKLLNVSERTVDRLAASGHLPKRKVRGCVCFLPSDVSAVSGITLHPLHS